MADAVTSALVKLIFEKLADEAFKKYVRSQGIHSELESLGRELSQIQVVLHDASEKEIKDEAVKQWLNSLQPLAYDIDDVLDDVATEAMRHELIQKSGASTSKVRNLIVPTCCTKFLLSHRLSPKLDSITIELQRLYKAKTELGLIVKDEIQKDGNRGNETSLLESDVVGREGEKEKLLMKLLGDDLPPSNKNFNIVPIVGMGGVGKTTLARYLYNDKQVEDHFELRAWMCREIKRGSGDLNQLQMALKEKLKDKRFLIVVDDVWTESYEKWENFVLPFHSGAPGSRIIMTTCKDQLLKKPGIDHFDNLQSLSNKDALSLFVAHALGADNFDSHPTLREKGEGIVEKCGGLPLALKAIGRLLRAKMDGEDWDAILKSEICDLENANEIVPALRLSYHDLSTNLKRLFAYCSLFPKDFLFEKDELVLLWMAEGFLNQSKATKSPERSGHECFEALLSRSFLQHAPNDKSLFIMHDLMNDLATFVSGDFFLRFNNHRDMRKEAVEKYHHISFLREIYVAYPKFKPLKRAKHLRTFLAVSVGVADVWETFYLSNKILVDLLPKLPLLRVLSLSRFQITEVPDFIGRLKHLRYLNLSKTKIEVLPENVGNLYNLETLILFGCKVLTKLPQSFSKLTQLRHLDIRDTPLLVKLPMGISELKSLQTLTKIIIEGDSGFAITELKGLNDLHGELSIQGLCNVKSAMHAHEAKLSLKRLTKLELDWGHPFNYYKWVTLEEEVVKELKPDSEWLKELAINSYCGVEFPKWVGNPSFDQLVHLSIRHCKNCTSLPPLGQLPSLKELFINGMDEVKFIGSELTGTNQLSVVAFSLLEILSFKNMVGWEVWSTNNNVLDVVFPCLRELHIEHCPKLIEVSLKTLPSLEILRFKYMRGWKVWSTNNAVFPCLNELCINNCPNLVELSLATMTSLRFLEIYGCGDGVLRSLVQAVHQSLCWLYVLFQGLLMRCGEVL
ncbi:putative virus X resistance protein-like, coiled-coil [Helianthus annuus]|nr:putative virus X resistance protein-like, coiled-coil [Helianthus annuus]